jgi:hypothetical protein
MARRIELEVEGVKATARLLDDKAPEVNQKLWDALPIEENCRHVRWGGDAAYILTSKLKDPSFPLENRVTFYIPGKISLKPEFGELAFGYGQALARNAKGNGWATELAVFEGGAEEFLEVMERTISEGGKRLVIRRQEG